MSKKMSGEEKNRRRMNKIFRKLFENAVKDGSERERRDGIIYVGRFSHAMSDALGIRDCSVNTNIYLGMAVKAHYLSVMRPDPMSGITQDFAWWKVDVEIWANDGFILSEEERLQDTIVQVKLENAPKKRQAKNAPDYDELVIQ